MKAFEIQRKATTRGKAKYLEHEKMQKTQRESQAIGEFLDWLQNMRKPPIALCLLSTEREHFEHWYPAPSSIETLLAEYFQIDLAKVEQEKRAMLEEMREANRKVKQGRKHDS